MPGYFIHLAACQPKTLHNQSFVRGVEMPDLLKTYLKLYGLEGAEQKYNSIKTSDMPEFDRFKERVQQKEIAGKKFGMHYGVSSTPDILCFWNSLSEEEHKNPFWIGYLWHLLTDLVIYTYMDLDTKFKIFLKEHADAENLEELRLQEIEKMHEDWDKTNTMVKYTYPDVELPEEIQELNIVSFSEGNSLAYVDWWNVKLSIDLLRNVNPLEENLEKVLEIYMGLVHTVDKKQQ